MVHKEETAVSLFFLSSSSSTAITHWMFKLKFSPNGVSPCSGEGFSLSIHKVMGRQQVGHHLTLAVVLAGISNEQS